MQNNMIVSFIDPFIEYKGLITICLVVFLVFLLWLTLRHLATYYVAIKIQTAHKKGLANDDHPEVTQWLKNKSITFFWLHLAALVVISYSAIRLYSQIYP